MIEKTIAKRYADALLGRCEADHVVEPVEVQILEAADLWRKSRDLRQALTHPSIPTAKKCAMVRTVFASWANPLLVQFIELLVRRRRIDILPDAAEAFDRLADRSRGVVKVHVRSFRPLSDAHRAGLEAKLASKLQRKIHMTQEVDAALLGGLTVRIGDTVVDGSVSGRLRRLRETLLEREREAAALMR